MTAVDTLKQLLEQGITIVGENKDKIEDVLDKASAFVDEKTGGKYSETIAKGKDTVKAFIPAPPSNQA
ncbi:antitoxin [Smaragdicoccus niigatensis]|uniref:antitoxin n=1 Tax=Smaragdicoccus niigatensis TaxID=359359 RepID=UPI000362CAC2|nr:antitoxin [Smaragdicoccus niigatensis]